MDFDNISGIAKQICAWLAAIGVIVDLTPGIKICPVRWIIKKIGNMLNFDIKTQLDRLERDFEKHKVESQRCEILDFANSCMNKRNHTKEEFDHIIKIHDDYDEYINQRNIKNGQVKVAYDYIEKLYEQNLKHNSFL